MQTIKEFTEADAGCIFDGSRGHYIIPAVIEFACSLGFIIGQFERFALDSYDERSHEDSFPYEAMIELCDDAERWLGSGSYHTYVGNDRIAGQNAPPKLPDSPREGYAYNFGFEDGDFGLWLYDLETGEVADLPLLG